MKISGTISVVDAGETEIRLARRDVKSVVRFRGSFAVPVDFQNGEDLLQEMTVALLNKGTLQRDRFAIARIIEDCGAGLSFFADGKRIGFMGRALRRDVPVVLEVLAEQLLEPALDNEQFEKALLRIASNIRRDLESTASAAATALSKRLFSEGHPNFDRTPEETLTMLDRLSPDAVRAYHTNKFRLADAVICVAGDLDPKPFESFAADAFGRMEKGEGMVSQLPAPPGESDSRRVDLPMDDRQNLDVRIGHSIDINRRHPDFAALFVANYILGGNFSARLMDHVRERLGLTYGINSGLLGFDRFHGGYWRTAVTLSQENLERGIEETLGVIKRFVEEGASEEELVSKKQTLRGLFQVGLSTTEGLVQTLHRHYRQGFEASYIDQYPDEIEALTLEEVNRAVRAHFDPGKLQITVAGTLPESGKAGPTSD